jgi:hypothetical protein
MLTIISTTMMFIQQTNNAALALFLHVGHDTCVVTCVGCLQALISAGMPVIADKLTTALETSPVGTTV